MITLFRVVLALLITVLLGAFLTPLIEQVELVGSTLG
jgi:hypothetical protein